MCDNKKESKWYDSDFADIVGFGIMFFCILAGMGLLSYLTK